MQLPFQRQSIYFNHLLPCCTLFLFFLLYEEQHFAAILLDIHRFFQLNRLSDLTCFSEECSVVIYVYSSAGVEGDTCWVEDSKWTDQVSGVD